MFIKQLYTNCLSEAAYYIESNGEAAIIAEHKAAEVMVVFDVGEDRLYIPTSLFPMPYSFFA